MLGIRKKVAAVAAANELREEERDAATSMLTASSADTGSGSDDTAPQHSEPPRVKLWDESSMQYRDHHPPAATVSSADATGLRREQVEPSIDAKCAVADEEHDGDVDGRIRFGSFESFDLRVEPRCRPDRGGLRVRRRDPGARLDGHHQHQ